MELERTSFVLRIAQEDYEDYVERHRHVYPELLKAFGETGIATYSIFYHEGLLFNYLEAENVAETMDQLTAYPVYARWQEYMSDMLLKNEAGKVSTDIPEVFHFKTKRE